ncbi:MAG: NAD(P)-dependent alcohol dehydrogenase [Christensenellales bacterium]|jgi:L-iditol 2-dehydrogenase
MREIPNTMRVFAQTGLMQVEAQTRPTPKPQAGEVLVAVRHVGVCGSDLHYFEHGKVGPYEVTFPFILGHECAGEIVAVGEGVDPARVGERVALEPGVTCGKCVYCKTGRYNLCPQVKFFATPPYDGTFCEYVAHPADMSFPLPAGMDTLEGCLIEPLAVGMHAAAQGGACIGQTAVVLGSGCIGLCTLMSLKARGVSKVYVVDVIAKRLAKAAELGADEAINAASQDAVARVLELTGGRGADLVIETAGATRTTQQTAELVARGGVIVIVGLSPEPLVPFPMGIVADKEATIKTVFRYRNQYPAAIEAVASGRIPVRQIATDIRPFDQTPQGLTDNVTNKQEIVKMVIAL